MAAFQGIVAAPLGDRDPKPRRQGVTVVMDKGLGLTATRDILDLAAAYIDIWKSYPNWARWEDCVCTAPLRPYPQSAHVAAHPWRWAVARIWHIRMGYLTSGGGGGRVGRKTPLRIIGTHRYVEDPEVHTTLQMWARLLAEAVWKGRPVARDSQRI